ncbi:MAG: hypothetical protein PVH64_03330 [Bacillota bacterium]
MLNRRMLGQSLRATANFARQTRKVFFTLTVKMVFLGILFGVGFYVTVHYLQPFQKIKIRDRELRINPGIRLDSSRSYRVLLWDYDWPLGEGNYRQYLQQQIAEFKRHYPNIAVELRLLDLLTGPAELEEALRKGKPPDVYCSSMAPPPGFDFKYQAPVGPYLQREVSRSRYFTALRRLTEIDGVQCSFPRWVRPNLWLGNRRLLELAGLSVAAIQARGWSWEELLRLREQLPPGHYPVVGRVVPETVLHQIGSREGLVNPESAEWNWLRLVREAKVLPLDYNLKMLEYFSSGRAAVLAGVKPIIWGYLKKRLVRLERPWEPVWLPAPGGYPGNPRQTVELGVINVYRRPRRRPEQIRAALKLGEYLSRCRGAAAPWSELMFIPAARAAAVKWFRQIGQGESGLKLLEPGLGGGQWRLSATSQVRIGEIDALVQKFLIGKVTQLEAIKLIQRELGER